jgi:hypothetical protein
MRGNCTPVGIECAVNLLIAAYADTGTNQDHQVFPGEHPLLQSKTFADQPFDPVAFHGVAGGFDRDNHAQAGVIQAVGSCQYCDQAVTGLMLALFENPLILGCAEQAVVAGITRRHDLLDKPCSGRQAGAPFGPTRLDHETAALGAHPGTKTVDALALQVAGLKCSLHGAIGSQIVKRPLLGRAGSGRADYWFHPGAVNCFGQQTRPL